VADNDNNMAPHSLQIETPEITSNNGRLQIEIQSRNGDPAGGKSESYSDELIRH